MVFQIIRFNGLILQIHDTKVLMGGYLSRKEIRKGPTMKLHPPCCLLGATIFSGCMSWTHLERSESLIILG
jgi:hypothetical protein